MFENQSLRTESQFSNPFFDRFEFIPNIWKTMQLIECPISIDNEESVEFENEFYRLMYNRTNTPINSQIVNAFAFAFAISIPLSHCHIRSSDTKIKRPILQLLICNPIIDLHIRICNMQLSRNTFNWFTCWPYGIDQMDCGTMLQKMSRKKLWNLIKSRFGKLLSQNRCLPKSESISYRISLELPVRWPQIEWVFFPLKTMPYSKFSYIICVFIWLVQYKGVILIVIVSIFQQNSGKTNRFGFGIDNAWFYG